MRWSLLSGEVHRGRTTFKEAFVISNFFAARMHGARSKRFYSSSPVLITHTGRYASFSYFLIGAASFQTLVSLSFNS